MKALVTGAGGFVGGHLLAHLTAEGDDVIPCDRLHGGVDITHGEAVGRMIADAAPDAVYHLAGWADVGASWRVPEEVFAANAVGTLNVLRACADAGVGRVLSVGSADVYGKVAEDELPLTEESPLRPVSPYAASKVAADFLGLQAWLGRSLPVVRVRAFNHLGPGQGEQFVASALASRIARNENDGGDVIRVGNLSARRDFTDVRDVVRAYRMLIRDGVPGEVYNLCTGTAIAVQELAEMMLVHARRSMRLETDPDLARPVDTPVLLGDPSKLHDATGWKTEIPLERTVLDLLDDWRTRVRT
ncbi:GDP-mannose 4,6-dehydratase [soil metagenome]